MNVRAFLTCAAFAVAVYGIYGLARFGWEWLTGDLIIHRAPAPVPAHIGTDR